MQQKLPEIYGYENQWVDTIKLVALGSPFGPQVLISIITTS